ncbi:MAG: siderophore-iron reductase FhuF [Methylorubrum populi]
MTLEALAPLFTGPLAPYADRLVPASDPRPGVSGRALLDPEILAERLARFARNYEAPEPRAVASIWSKHHLASLVVPTLLAELVLGRTLPVALDAVEVIAGADGRSSAFRLRESDPPLAPRGRFAPLIDGHLEPLFDGLAAVSGLRPRVLWSNAGLVFDGIARQAEALPLPDRAGLDALRRLLADARRPDGRPNALHAPVRLVGPAGAASRRRRVCCLRYLIPAQGLCGTCPIETRPA